MPTSIIDGSLRIQGGRLPGENHALYTSVAMTSKPSNFGKSMNLSPLKKNDNDIKFSDALLEERLKKKVYAGFKLSGSQVFRKM